MKRDLTFQLSKKTNRLDRFVIGLRIPTRMFDTYRPEATYRTCDIFIFYSFTFVHELFLNYTKRRSYRNRL